MIDEEQDEIRIENKAEFDTNVKVNISSSFFHINNVNSIYSMLEIMVFNLYHLLFILMIYVNLMEYII
jgi:hypothetical protein